MQFRVLVSLPYCVCSADLSSRAVQGVGLRTLACWDYGFESHRMHECLSLVSVVYHQAEISATSWSVVAEMFY